MVKHILLLAAAIGFIAQSSVFAADPTPAPSPAKGAVTESAAPSPAKTHRRQRVEARRKARQTHREARREARKGEATPTPGGAAATPTPKQ